MDSIWQATSEMPHFPTLVGDLKKDAVVVGGGMAGLLTAARLRQAGLDTAVIERGKHRIRRNSGHNGEDHFAARSYL